MLAATPYVSYYPTTHIGSYNYTSMLQAYEYDRTLVVEWWTLWAVDLGLFKFWFIVTRCQSPEDAKIECHL